MYLHRNDLQKFKIIKIISTKIQYYSEDKISFNE